MHRLVAITWTTTVATVFLACLPPCCVTALQCADLTGMRVPIPNRDARLGTPFITYDNRFDVGHPFWTEAELQRNQIVTRAVTTKHTQGLRMSVNEVADFLSIHGSLKLELLGGLISIKGSGGVLAHSYDVNNAIRATVVLEATTEHESLRKELLRTVQVGNPHLRRPQNYVTTAITKGFQIGLTLVYILRDGESVIEAEGKFKGVFDLVVASIEAHVDFRLEDKDRKVLEQTILTVDADIAITSFGQGPAAIEGVLHEVTEKLRNLESLEGVPLYATLAPICQWHQDPVSIILNNLNTQIIEEASGVMATINAQQAWLDNLQHSAERVLGASATQEELERFGASFARYRHRLAEAFAQLLPDIRSGVQKEVRLRQVLAQHAASALSAANVDQWLDLKEQEIEYVKRLLNSLPAKVLHAPSLVDAMHPERRLNAVVALVFSPKTPGSNYLDAVETATTSVGAVALHAGAPSTFVAAADSFLHTDAFAKLSGQVRWLTDVARDGTCVATLPGYVCNPDRQVLAFVDYHSNRQAIDAHLANFGVDVPLHESRVLLFHAEPHPSIAMALVNTRLQRCLSTCDPRDRQGICLYDYGNVPDGCSCALPDATNDFRNGLCQSRQCKVQQPSPSSPSSALTALCGTDCVPLVLDCGDACFSEVLAARDRAQQDVADEDARHTAAVAEENARHEATVQGFDHFLTDVVALPHVRTHSCSISLGSAYSNIAVGYSLNGDVNEDSGGWDIFLCEQKLHNGMYLVNMKVQLFASCGSGWRPVRFSSTNTPADMNTGAGGKDVFVCLMFASLTSAIGSKTWPIYKVGMVRQRSQTPRNCQLVPAVTPSNGDLSQDAGGKDKFLYYCRTPALPNELSRHSDNVDSEAERYRSRLASLNATLRAREENLADARDGQNSGTCPNNTRPNVDAATEGTCPCVRNNPCDTDPCSIQRGMAAGNAVCSVTSSERQTYTCSCKPRWTGPKCDQPVDVCAANPCKVDEFCVLISDNLGPIDRVCRKVSATQPGLELVAPATPTSDAVVVGCPAGTFSSSGTGRCVSHTVASCPCGHRMAVVPSAVTDGLCVPCRPGEHQPDHNHTHTSCRPASNCAPLQPGMCLAGPPCKTRVADNNDGGGGGNGGGNGGMVAGVVVVVVVVVVLIAVVVYRRRRHGARNGAATNTTGVGASVPRSDSPPPTYTATDLLWDVGATTDKTGKTDARKGIYLQPYEQSNDI